MVTSDTSASWGSILGSDMYRLTSQAFLLSGF